MKGDFNDICNRTACNNPRAIFYNHSTKKYYCVGCAHMINERNRTNAILLYGHDLCTLVKDDKVNVFKMINESIVSRLDNAENNIETIESLQRVCKTVIDGIGLSIAIKNEFEVPDTEQIDLLLDELTKTQESAMRADIMHKQATRTRREFNIGAIWFTVFSENKKITGIEENTPREGGSISQDKDKTWEETFLAHVKGRITGDEKWIDKVMQAAQDFLVSDELKVNVIFEK
jgi:hypothetical protein